VLLEVLTTGFEAANSDIGISRYEIIHPDELDSSAIITISTSKQQTQIKKKHVDIERLWVHGIFLFPLKIKNL